MKVHINDGNNNPICGEVDYNLLAGVRESTTCTECQKLRAEAIKKLRTLRRLNADRTIVKNYLYGNSKASLSEEDIESYRIRLEEIEIESKKNHPESTNEAYLMSELSMPITKEAEYV